MHAPTHVQVDIESEELRRAAADTANPEAMLDLEPQQVVRTEDAGLGQPLTHQPLEADEGKYSRSPNVYSHLYGFCSRSHSLQSGLGSLISEFSDPSLCRVRA